MRLSGKTAVVTGAASGIGRATALRFAAEGAQVVAADIDEAGGNALAEESGRRIRFHRTDVTSAEDIAALMDFAAAESGGIDVLFNNAGAGGAKENIAEIAPDGWDRTMDLLLRSVAFGIRYAVPHMQTRRGASIINTASVAALRSGYAPTAYSVAKAGVLHLSKLAAADLAQFGIRVNAVLPGFINTNIFTSSVGLTGDTAAQAKALIAQMSSNAQPVRRSGTPDDIAGAVLYLASDDASFVTGTSILVDGGLTIGERYSWDPEMPGLFDSLEAFAAQAGMTASPATT